MEKLNKKTAYLLIIFFVFLSLVAIVLAEVYFTISLNSPENNTATSDTTPTFNYTVSGSESCYSCNLYLCSGGILKKYNSSGGLISEENFSSSCPSGYIWVPGNPIYNTDTGFCGGGFCVMKYEAKNNGSDSPISQASGTPWVDIKQTEAKAKCESLGANYHLITNDEWMTIARNIEQVADNWQSGTVGTGCMFGGHMDNHPSNALAASTDDDPYYGTSNNAGEAAVCPFDTTDGKKASRRTLTLSNGEVIWDLSGNVWEWTDNNITCVADTCTSDEMPQPTGWQEFTVLTSYGSLSSYDEIKPSDSSYNSNYGTGRIYNDPDEAYPSGNVHAFVRGGYWYYGAYAGAFALCLNNAPSDSNTYIGFRCVLGVS